MLGREAIRRLEESEGVSPEKRRSYLGVVIGVDLIARGESGKVERLIAIPSRNRTDDRGLGASVWEQPNDPAKADAAPDA